jgi:hypothetical protein
MVDVFVISCDDLNWHWDWSLFGLFAFASKWFKKGVEGFFFVACLLFLTPNLA